MNLGAYRLNSPDVVTEVFDDDLVVLNLKSGVCVNLTGRSKAFFGLVEQGVDVDSLIATLADQHNADPAVMKDAVQGLIKERMIVADHGNPLRPADESDVTEVASAGEAFELEYFTDFSDLLASDPIHDADPGTGWPLQNG